MDRLQDDMHNKTPLLLLANFEHVVAAASLVADVVGPCPAVKMGVTTREVLQSTASLSTRSFRCPAKPPRAAVP